MYSSQTTHQGAAASHPQHYIIIPQAKYQAPKWQSAMHSQRLLAPICFDYHGYSGLGVSMHDLKIRGIEAVEVAQKVAGAYDPILVGTGMAKVIFHIVWPGYNSSKGKCKRIIELETKRGQLTRIQLGVAVVSQFVLFIDDVQRSGTPTSQPAWRVGAGAVTVEDLRLVALHNLFDNYWQAVVTITKSRLHALGLGL